MLLHCRNEPAAAAATPGPSVRLSMWGRDPAEPTAVPQDGAGSKPHAAAEPGPGPTPGSEPGSTSGLPGEHRPQRMAPSCQHLHQQQVGTDDESPDQHDGWSLFFFCKYRWPSLPLYSVYPQQSQSQYSTQPNGGMYSSNNNMNMAVMANNAGNMNQMSGQMSSMNTEQVRDDIVCWLFTVLMLISSFNLYSLCYFHHYRWVTAAWSWSSWWKLTCYRKTAKPILWVKTNKTSDFLYKFESKISLDEWHDSDFPSSVAEFLLTPAEAETR